MMMMRWRLLKQEKPLFIVQARIVVCVACLGANLFEMLEFMALHLYNLELCVCVCVGACVHRYLFVCAHARMCVHHMSIYVYVRVCACAHV